MVFFIGLDLIKFRLLVQQMHQGLMEGGGTLWVYLQSPIIYALIRSWLGQELPFGLFFWMRSMAIRLIIKVLDIFASSNQERGINHHSSLIRLIEIMFQVLAWWFHSLVWLKQSHPSLLRSKFQISRYNNSCQIILYYKGYHAKTMIDLVKMPQSLLPFFPFLALFTFLSFISGLKD